MKRGNRRPFLFPVDDAKSISEELVASGAKIDYTLCEHLYGTLWHM